MFDLTEFNKKNICLIGLMGSGKSMIGKDLSRYLDFRFFDSDKEIELKTRKNINLIFKENGESYFRNVEEKVCLKLLKKDNCVISLGGGSVVNNKIRKSIKQNSYSIYLKVKLNNLIQRLESSKKRPLLNYTLDKKKILENIYNARKSFYENADFIVNNDKDKLQVLKKITEKLNSNAK